MTKQEAFDEINKLQDMYVDNLSKLINDPDFSYMTKINFTSATGTGKTKMMAKLINKHPNFYFIVTTLSRGQLHLQVRESLEKDCKQNNFSVYGCADYKINSKLQANDIIGKIPKETKCIWLRDEGHIRTSRFDDLLIKYCHKIVNFSATNMHNDIRCNFTQTMMLRTVNQTTGTPEDAIKKLLEIKNAHKNVKHYNPCAIFRCVNGNKELNNIIIDLCKKHNLKYIDITQDEFLMADLCRDDNEYDVIINKFKIIEGIDIRRAHVLYMDNCPSNNATTIQVIGRCRRNALLYRNDIDILRPENANLLKNTRECYVYYNVEKMNIETDQYGELQYHFCNHISCEELKTGTTIEVVNGQLPNGLYVIELENRTGKFEIVKDKNTGFNIVLHRQIDFYNTITEHFDNNYIYIVGIKCKKIHIKNIENFSLKTGAELRKQQKRLWPSFKTNTGEKKWDNFLDRYYYEICPIIEKHDIPHSFQSEIIQEFKKQLTTFNKQVIVPYITGYTLDTLEKPNYDINFMKNYIRDFVKKQQDEDSKYFCEIIKNLKDRKIKFSAFSYKLGEVCSDLEIVFLQYFCIKKKEQGVSYFDLFESFNEKICYIDKYLYSRDMWFSLKHKEDKDFSVILKDTFCDISVEKMEEEIRDFKEKAIKSNKNKDFCNMLSVLLGDGFCHPSTKQPCNDEIYKKLREALGKKDLITVGYFLVMQKKNKKTNKYIKNKVYELYQLLYNFYCIKDASFDDVSYNILSKNCLPILSSFEMDEFTVKTKINGDIRTTVSDVSDYFYAIKNKLKKICVSTNIYLDSSLITLSIINTIENTYQKLCNGVIPCVQFDCSDLLEDVKEEEMCLMHGCYRFNCYSEPLKIEIPQSILKKIKSANYYLTYTKTTNDKESATIGPDLMHQIKKDNGNVVWTESRSVSSKIGNHNKLNSFISIRYENELKQAKEQLFKGKNDFKLDKKCNSVIGYCVEYYSKYLLYGESYLEEYIEQAKKETKIKEISDAIIVRACFLRYRENMLRCFGSGVSKIIRGISASQLIKEKYSYFVSLVIELGKKTATFVKKTLYESREIKNNIDDNLSIRHIAGRADYITTDTILDVKVRNNIDENCVRQVLAYHYLSTKRSDLNIKRVIVYDAVSDKAVIIDISPENIARNSTSTNSD